jgi:hypothetical protein
MEVFMDRHVIVIPSKDRASIVSRYVDSPLNRFKDSIFNTHLWVNSTDKEDYRNVLYNLGYHNSVQLIEETLATNIAETRESILQWANKCGYNWLFMVDDDVRFFSRSMNYKALPVTKEDTKDMVNHLISICTPEYPLVSTRERFMVNQCEYAYEKNAKIIRVYMIHVPTFIKLGISFMYKGIKVFEDKLVQVMLNEKGYRTITSVHFAQSTRDSSNSNGGCAEYRTNLETERCVDIFLKDFPKAFTETVKMDYKDGPVRYVKSTLKNYLDPGELKYVPSGVMETIRSDYKI